MDGLQTEISDEILTAQAMRLGAVQARITEACRLAGRDPRTVRLLAVSKTHPPIALRMFHQLGLSDFGENYAQEMTAKAKALADLPVRFSFIGTVQSNKIKTIVETAAEIQTLTNLRHAHLIAGNAIKFRKTPFPVYIEVNAGGEVSKSGLSAKDTLALAAAIHTELPHLKLMGIMAIPPALARDRQKGELPILYSELSVLAKKVGEGCLSLGMSDDLEEAITAGSTCVRIGTALFGQRL